MPEIEICLDEDMYSSPQKNGLDFMSFYLNEWLADIWLTVGEQRFPAHKILLALKSEVLKKKFTENSMLRKLEFEGSSPETLKAFLKFIYGNSYVKNHDIFIAHSLMRLSQEFQISDLPLLVIEEITALIDNNNGFLNVSSFGQILTFVENYKLTKVHSKVITFGAEHIKDILQTEFITFEDNDKIQRVVSALKPTQTQIMEALTPEVIILSSRSPQEFEIFIDLTKCSIKELIDLYERKMFATYEPNLLSMAKNRSKILEDLLRGSLK